MQNTDYFDLKVYEGTDIFNPLMVENENIEKIDEQMFLNSIATIGQATELKSGTVHALTRENPDAAMFRFVATSKFDRGDTFTVDGIQVTGLTTDGKTLADGAYVINANVLCCLTGSVLTLFVAGGEVSTADNALKLGGELPAFYATASDAQTALNTANAAGLLAGNANETANSALNAVASLKEYKTTEEVVGTFIDGKPIYKKTYHATGVNISANTVIDSALNTAYIDNVVKIEPMFYMSNGQWLITYDVEGFIANASIGAFGLRVNTVGGIANINGYNITVFYTKK